MQPVEDEERPAVAQSRSENNPVLENSIVDEKRWAVSLNNRFSRRYNVSEVDTGALGKLRRHTQTWFVSQEEENLSGIQPRREAIGVASPHHRPDIGGNTDNKI